MRQPRMTDHLDDPSSNRPRAKAGDDPADPIDPGANGDPTKSRVVSGDHVKRKRLTLF
jgi:hypothetical protein